MAYEIPDADDFKEYFDRDFPYAEDDDDLTKIRDKDIEKAIVQANFNFNSKFFSTQENFTMGFLWLTAHYLVIDLRAASQGIAGNYSWLQTSKSAGSVSEGFTVPQRILDNPELAMLSRTPYGAKYLSLILPQLMGQVLVVCGRTTA